MKGLVVGTTEDRERLVLFWTESLAAHVAANGAIGPCQGTTVHG